jgi:hypothetical protein
MYEEMAGDFAEVGQQAGFIALGLQTREHLMSITAEARHDVIMGLSIRLGEMSIAARRRDRKDLQTMLAELSDSFRLSAAEIASASYGPALIERMAASVGRIEQSLAA